MTLDRTGFDLASTAQQLAHMAVEINSVAHDLGGDREGLRLRAIGLEAEAGRLALAALSVRAAAAEIACAAKEPKP